MEYMQVNLDIPTMLFMDVLIGVSLSIVVGLSMRDRIICPGLHFWVASLSSSSAGLLFFWLRWCIPLWISVGLSNFFLLLGYPLLWLGFRQYTKELRKLDKYIVLVPILVAMMQTVVTIADPNSLAFRSKLFSYVMILLVLLTANQALKNRKDVETGRLLFIFCLLFTLLSTLIRVLSINHENWHVNFLTDSMSSIVYMASSGISLVWTATSIMLISSQWLQQRLYVHATYDALTGVYNRYALIELSETIELTNYLSGATWSLAIIDIDHFKYVNDQYGHQVGDVVLREIAQEIKKKARYNDIVARYGGEEFVVVLTNCDQEKAKEWGERVRLFIESNVISVEDTKINVTISIGISSSSKEKHSFHDVLGMADSALYMAKQNGRNQICINK